MTAFLGLAPSSAPALIDAESGECVSFASLLERAHRVVEPIASAGQLVFVSARIDISTPVAYAGCVLAGHAVALLDDDATLEATADLVEAYRPPWLIGPAGLADRLRAAGVSVTNVHATPDGDVVRTGEPSARVHPDLAVLLATSGTTGSRKFVRLSRRNLESNAASIAEYLKLAPSERPIATLPFHYSFGLSVLDSHWFVGAPVVIAAGGLLRKQFWAGFREQSCTSLAGVPYTYQMLERTGFREMDLPSLRTLQQAGGALDLRLARAYADFMAARGGRFFVMYGQTEATARIAYVPPERLEEKLGSAGIAIPGGRLSIDAKGGVGDAKRGTAGAEGGPSSAAEAAGARPTGEVVYEGPNVMMGYASGRDELGFGDELGGVLRTGDIGYLDAEGFLYLVGRSKRIAKVYGLRVNLDEVEAIVRENGPAAVVADEECIVGFCGFGTDESVEALRLALAGRFRLNPNAIRLHRVEAIPTVTSGKVDYRLVQAWAATWPGSGSEAPAAP